MKSKTGRKSMAHKFSHKWTSNLFIGSKLVSDGKIDPSKMKDDGKIDDGRHENSNKKLTGEADSNRFVRLRFEDDSGEYRGELIHDGGGKMIIAGILDLINPPLDDQDDPPWIMTR